MKSQGTRGWRVPCCALRGARRCVLRIKTIPSYVWQELMQEFGADWRMRVWLLQEITTAIVAFEEHGILTGRCIDGVEAVIVVRTATLVGVLAGSRDGHKRHGRARHNPHRLDHQSPSSGRKQGI